jgi:hypothetical protein
VSDEKLYPLAACRSELLRLRWRGFCYFAPIAERSIRSRSFVIDRYRIGDGWGFPGCGSVRPHQAGLRTNIRFIFQAMVTRLHSPRALSSPRIENWRNPSTNLMMP